MVRAKPNAKVEGAPGIVAESDGRSLLLLRVRAAPQEGAANQALCIYLARLAGVAPSQVALEAGAQAKVKRFHIEGPADAIIAALAQAAPVEESRK